MFLKNALNAAKKVRNKRWSRLIHDLAHVQAAYSVH